MQGLVTSRLASLGTWKSTEMLAITTSKLMGVHPSEPPTSSVVHHLGPAMSPGVDRPEPAILTSVHPSEPPTSSVVHLPD